MPPSPEIRRILCEERQVEVYAQIEAEHFCHADSHIGVSRKIAVKLKRIGNNGKSNTYAVIRGGRGKNSVNRNGEPVGNYRLFKQSHCKFLNAPRKVFPGYRVRFGKLRKKVLGFNNGSRYNLREKTYV